jgi:hypothetical protein
MIEADIREPGTTDDINNDDDDDDDETTPQFLY